MKRYAVISPEYDSAGISEPPEPGRDYVEVEAESKQDALVLGVKLMRKEYPRGWHNLQAPDQNPFGGMLVEEVVWHYCAAGCGRECDCGAETVEACERCFYCPRTKRVTNG